MKTLLGVLCGLQLLCSAPLYATTRAPHLLFEATAVIGRGFTPNAQILVFGYANQPQPYTRRLMNFWTVVTADGAGGFRWEAPEPIANRSLWFAVESRSLDLVVAIPGNDDTPKTTLPPPILLVGQDGGSDALSISEYMAQVVVVRPNDTAWRGTAIRHGAADINRGRSGTHQLSLKTLTTAGPEVRILNRITPADMVVVVEPVSLRFWAGRILPN